MISLEGRKIAILTEEGFEEIELTSPKIALEAAGATVHVISPHAGSVRAWDHDHWSIEVPVDHLLGTVNPENYDGLVIPGGVLNPDKMRQNSHCVDFVQHFLETGKPIGAICHGPQLLIETGMIAGREMTSFRSIRTDLVNAGVSWVDQEVVADRGLVTSRSPQDLPAFNRKLIEEMAEGIHPPISTFMPAVPH